MTAPAVRPPPATHWLARIGLDRAELRAWVKRLGGPVRRAFVVHGATGPATAMAELLRTEGVGQVTIPQMGESFEL